MKFPAFLSYLLPYLAAGGLALGWGFIEIAQTFESDLRRALKSLWVYLFLGGHLLMTCLALSILDLALSLNPSRRLLLGILTGFGWQMLLRTRINLFQPLTGEQSESVALSILDFYRRFQNICWRQIDRFLLVKRWTLLDQASRCPLDFLKHQVLLLHLAPIVHPSGSDKQLDDFLKELGKHPEDKQRLYLAARLLRVGGYDFLREVVTKSGKWGVREHPPGA
jgi:hypothetical protein